MNWESVHRAAGRSLRALSPLPIVVSRCRMPREGALRTRSAARPTRAPPPPLPVDATMPGRLLSCKRPREVARCRCRAARLLRAPPPPSIRSRPRPARFFFGTKSGRITCPRFQSFSGQEAVFRHGPQYHGLPQRNSRTPGDVCDPSCRCLPAIPPHRALSAPCSVTRVAHLTRPRLGAADPHDTRRPPWDSQVQRLEDLEAVGAGPGVGECPNTAESKSRRQTRPSHLGPYARHEDELANGRGLVSCAEHSVLLQARTVANIKMEISRRDVFKEMAKKIFTTAGVLCPALSFLPVPVHPPLPIAPDSQHRVDFPQLHVRTCALLAPDTHPPASSARTQRTNPRPRKCARTSRRWARSRASPGSKRTCTRASGTSLRTTTSPRQALPPTLTERPNRSKDLP